MLFDFSEFRKPLPDNVLVFASGANRAPEIRGFARLGIPVGVSVNHLNEAGITALIESSIPAMIDSGAFSEIAFTADGPVTVSPIDEQDWHRRLGLYLRLASALGDRAMLVAPDQVGNQQETLTRLARHREELAAIVATGAILLLPLQVGPLSHREFFDAAHSVAAVALVAAMPMRKAATSETALLSFIEDVKPNHIHLLGIGIENRRAERVIDAIRFFSPATRISMDSNRLRAVAGRNRPLTVRETQLRGTDTEDVYGAVDSPVLTLNGEGLDYTDLIASPALWASPDQLFEIARALDLSDTESKELVNAPDEFLQSACRDFENLVWIEHPLMDLKLDRAWKQFVDRKLRTGVRSAAIAATFADSRISGQRTMPPEGRHQ